jgi:NADH:ubiquinone oxidoreductase subunit
VLSVAVSLALALAQAQTPTYGPAGLRRGPAPSPAAPAEAPADPMAAAAARAKAALVARHGEAQRARVERGVDQAARLWRPSDGTPAAFEAFVQAWFVADDAALATLLGRFEENLEELDGRALQANVKLARHAVLDIGPEAPVDALFAAFDAGAHLNDDLFDSRLAFVALLNFPATTLAERDREGAGWSRRRWAEVRLLGRRGALVGASDGGLSARVPAPVRQRISKAYAESQAYVAGYDLWVHHLVDGEPGRAFPKGKRLLSHWNLRDEVKASYGQPDALRRQRAIERAMERIVTQEIPRAAVNSPLVDWNPFTNEVRPAPAESVEDGRVPPATVDTSREPDTRYAMLLENFRAVREADPYSPAAPTAIARKFQVDRELSEERVTAMLTEIASSPLVARAGKLAAERLGRPLEPFDIWYPGFRPPGPPEAELDRLTRARYPDAGAYHADMPRMLEALGFPPARARWLAEHIVVEPARGSGHAQQAATRDDRPRLRTRVGPDGMDYKGYNIAVHEMGHNVEQVLSLFAVDHTLLSGVPGNAFTEALAFVFQARDRELLGLPAATEADRDLAAIDDLWGAWEMSGVALVELLTWKWLYAHPDATPAELRVAVVGIAKDVWNRWYAPILGARDVPLLAIYSHMVEEPLYLADYPIGIVIAAQLEERFRAAGKVGPEFERMATFGSLPPDLWTRNATGEPLSTRALLAGAQRALDARSR